MRLVPIALVLACLSAGPALAQAKADDSTRVFVAAVEACEALVESDAGEAAADAAVAKAGFTSDVTHSPMLQTHFMPDAVKVQWWRRPVSEGKVFIAYDAAVGYCNAFMLDRPARDTGARVLASQSSDYEPFQKGSSDYVRRRADGRYLTRSIVIVEGTGNLAVRVSVSVH